MDTYTDIDRARYKLAEAQRELDEATARQRKLDTFQTSGTVFILMAVHVSYDQWATYSEEGLPIGVFATKAEAERYERSFEHPAGLAYQIKEFPLYG